jgi:hypothetical protein
MAKQVVQYFDRASLICNISIGPGQSSLHNRWKCIKWLWSKTNSRVSWNECQKIYRSNVDEESLKFKGTDSNYIESKILQPNNVDIKTPLTLGHQNIVSVIGETNKTSCYYVRTSIG